MQPSWHWSKAVGSLSSTLAATLWRSWSHPTAGERHYGSQAYTENESMYEFGHQHFHFAMLCFYVDSRLIFKWALLGLKKTTIFTICFLVWNERFNISLIQFYLYLTGENSGTYSH